MSRPRFSPRNIPVKGQIGLVRFAEMTCGSQWPAWSHVTSLLCPDMLDIKPRHTHARTHSERKAGVDNLTLNHITAHSDTLSLCRPSLCMNQVSHNSSCWLPCLRKLIKVCNIVMQPALSHSCCSPFSLFCLPLVCLSSYLPVPLFSSAAQNPYGFTAVQLCLSFWF